MVNNILQIHLQMNLKIIYYYKYMNENNATSNELEFFKYNFKTYHSEKDYQIDNEIYKCFNNLNKKINIDSKNINDNKNESKIIKE